MPRKRMPIFPLFEEIRRVTATLNDAQFGRAVRHALSSYYAGEEQAETDGVISLAAAMMLEQAARYDSFREQQRENGSKPSAAKGSQVQPKEANNTDCKPGTPPSPSPSPSPSPYKKADKTPAPAKQARKSYGEFGWVKLSDYEYSRLVNDLGEAEVKRCIAYVDESAQATGNKNKWRDWNLVVRKCHRQGWGMNQQQNKGGYESGVDRLARLYREEFGE